MEMVQLVREVEELGYDFVWASEHHFGEPGYTSNPLLLLAALARSTRTIRLGTYVLLLPLHHPLRVAEDAIAVDVLSGGRLDLGVGLGFRQIEFDGFGIDRRDRVGRLEEGLEIIRQAFSGKPIRFSGRHFEIAGLSLMTEPLQPDGPPIWLAARSKAAARRAGRLGLHLMPLGGSAIRRAWEDELAAHGHDPGALSCAVWRPIFISHNPQRDLTRLEDQFRYFGRRHGGWAGTDGDVKFDGVIARAWSDDAIKGMNYLVGTPDDVLEELKTYYVRKPFTHYAAPIPPPYDLTALRTSLRLFATEVVPRFRAWQTSQP